MLSQNTRSTSFGVEIPIIMRYIKSDKSKSLLPLRDLSGRCLVLYLGHTSSYAIKWLTHWETTSWGCVLHDYKRNVIDSQRKMTGERHDK